MSIAQSLVDLVGVYTDIKPVAIGSYYLDPHDDVDSQPYIQSIQKQLQDLGITLEYQYENTNTPDEPSVLLWQASNYNQYPTADITPDDPNLRTQLATWPAHIRHSPQHYAAEYEAYESRLRSACELYCPAVFGYYQTDVNSRSDSDLTD